MLNANQLLRRLQHDPIMDGINHKKLSDLLSGTKGKFSRKQIQHVRKVIRTSLSEVDSILMKLENE